MKQQLLLITSLLSGCVALLVAQEISIQPYLQDASPTTISILWETTSQDESIVEWGPSEALGNTTMGIAYTSNGDATIHEVNLQDLQRFTKYFYRVKTGAAISEIFHFKTPPFASDHEPVRIVAMSDMQKDNSHPDKFREIVEEGVITYLSEEFGGDIVDNLALVMIPGDLVVNGNTFNQWRNDFFNPAEQLLRHVPVYPVLGNHENNSAYFFTYFKMPENGTSDFAEHWWFKDYGNVRIIGLDSNGPFTNAEQLSWLDDMLDASCDYDSIDFVFAQLHHPHKSELWTPGESDFTGQVIERLEQFSTGCGKPSIHFFGHTHGYSRGQSRDHKHLWINVATAGGAIDNWGEFPNADYDEFSVSQDEYGFVMLEITADEDPKVVVKRINRGDQDVILDNYISDSLTIRLHSTTVDIPSPISPIEKEVAPECVTLMASAFLSSTAEATHGQTHWQVTTFENGFDDPVVDSWRNFENWYFEIDTQEGDDLTDEAIVGLEEYTSYLWRVRYRDREFNWSDWCEPVSFTTGASLALPNLLQNPGAESDLENWETLEGVVEALTSGVCDGVAPYSGEKYLNVGGLCEHSAVGRAGQNVDVSAYADGIDASTESVNFGGYLSNFGGSDLPELKVIFLDESNITIGESNTLSTLNNSWTLLSDWVNIPAQTRTIQMELKGTRNAGTDNDCYFDNLFIRVGTGEIDCSDVTSTTAPRAPYVSRLKIAPNPMQDYCLVQIPETVSGEVILQMVDMSGRKINPIQSRIGDAIRIDSSTLVAGQYLLWLREENKIVGMGKVSVMKD